MKLGPKRLNGQIFYSLEVKLKVLVGQLREARKEMEVLPEPEMKITNLPRELAVQDAKYGKYSENQEKGPTDQAPGMKKFPDGSVVQAIDWRLWQRNNELRA